MFSLYLILAYLFTRDRIEKSKYSWNYPLLAVLLYLAYLLDINKIFGVSMI